MNASKHVDLLLRQGRAYEDFMSGTPMAEAVASHGARLSDLEAMLRNISNESVNELATEIASRLGSDLPVDIAYVTNWIVMHFAELSSIEDPVAEFSKYHHLPSRINRANK